MSTMEVEAQSPGVTHTMTCGRSAAKNPADRIIKERVRGMVTS
jgi:hypothetical protein